MEFFIGLYSTWVYFILSVGIAFIWNTHMAHPQKEISNQKSSKTYPPKNNQTQKTFALV